MTSTLPPSSGPVTDPTAVVSVSDETAQQVRALATEAGGHEADAYAAATWLLLGRYAGQEDPVRLVRLGVGDEPRSLPHRAPDDVSFADVVRAVVDLSAPGAVDGAAATVRLVWGEYQGPATTGSTLDLHVRAGSTGRGPQVRGLEGGRPTARAAAVATDLVTLLDALAASTGPVSGVDAFAHHDDPSPGETPDAPFRGLVARVLENAETRPEAVAVRGTSDWTYATLVERARQVAGTLAARGVRREERVGLCVGRDEELAAGLLGVLLAGAAFVPLSGDDPVRRRRDVIDGAGVRVVLAAGSACADLAGDVDVVSIEACAGAAVVADVLPGPEDAAYVLFTSGSTGRPKGVVVEHRHLMAYVDGFLSRLFEDGAPAGPLDCALVQPLTVDSSLTCVAAAWATGGELRVVDRATSLHAGRLADAFAGRPVDVLKIAPSHLRALESAGDLAALLPRVALVVGGEASDWAWLQSVQDAAGCVVYNHYGPTETTVGVLMLDVRTHRGRPWTTAALGRPIGGCEVGVVDTHGNEVPRGSRGEIVVRGPLVARGYQAVPTVGSGFRPWRGRAAYWTGDQGTRDADGVIRFVGRVDDQVKVRGFRVELGEVERAVETHPEVARAVALLGTDGTDHAVLACAVQSRPGARPAVGELSAHCRTAVPEHMVPTRWLPVTDLPRTPHGKVDRAALRSLLVEAESGSDGEAGQAPAAGGQPSDDLPGLVAAAWGDVLVRYPARHDLNFFDAGGHSLLLVDLQRAITRRTGREIELLDLFEHPTVADQARLLQAGTHAVRRPEATDSRRRRQESLAARRRDRMARRRTDDRT